MQVTKGRHIILLTFFFLIQCSKIEDKNHQNAETFLNLKSKTVVTNLPVLNFEVDQKEFATITEKYLDDIKIKGRLFLYRKNQLKIDNEPISMEIKGSHSASYDLKSLGISFKNPFDNSDRDLLNPIKILPFHNLDQISAFRLRNSGNDFFLTMIKDLCYSQLAIDADLDIDLAYGEQALVFINDRFHGIMNLRSECNSKGISRLYQTTVDNVTLAKIENPGIISFRSGNKQQLTQYIAAIESENQAYLLENTDLENFTDYMIFQSFIANYDWPYNNVRFYSINNQPFRFVLYDIDWANTLNLGKDPMYFIESEKENIISDLFSILHTDTDFKAFYKNRFNEIISMHELTPLYFNSVTDFFIHSIKNEMPWQIQKFKSPESITEWYRETDILKLHYKKRYHYFF